eukprot:TRINITY_DN4796_c0_g1_i1.p1 TRINITY_DN4796_c0_g1~~TRINITY_DN4796_c0_g1_i1.p1  ORF type:complete len:764 (+),score=271.29 TRINITY_DN4796_c0_g1_i1:47-2338(+)
MPDAGVKFYPGATGVEEKDVGVGLKKYRWTFDGKDFDWECYDDGDWYPLIGKKKLRQVLKMMHGEDGNNWGNPLPVSDKNYQHVKVWARPPTIAGAKTNEVRLEGDIEGVRPEVFFNVLNEEHYRATWDNNMVKGYNIAKFTRNNDIGYYEASIPAPMTSNRDFCNQRAWMELGDEHYIICNYSKPHTRCPPKKGVVRGKSFITGYYMRPSKRDPSATTVTYVTCPDPGGALPTWVINMVQTKKGPEMICNLGKSAKALGPWLDKVYQESQSNGGAAVAGPWDKTLQKPGLFIPRDPATPGYYRNPVMPLDQEAREVQALVKDADAEVEKLLAEEKKDFGDIKKQHLDAAAEFPEDQTTPALRRQSSARVHIKAVDALATDIEKGPAGTKAASLDKLHQLELAVKAAESEHMKVKERLAVFARTPGGDPFTRVPADEPAVCSDFRRKVADLTASVALELTEQGRVNDVNTVEYLYLILSKLEGEYLLPDTNTDAKVCPAGHGRIPYNEMWRFLSYGDRPDSTDVWMVKFVLWVTIISAVINFIVVIHAFREDYWEIALLALGYIVLGDWTLWWACRDVHYKDKPFSAGGKAIPLLWPIRFQLIPILPVQPFHLLRRVPGEMMKWDTTTTHANVIYRFTFFYSFMRLLLHHIPIVYLFSVVQYRSGEVIEPTDPLMSFAFWMVFLVPNIVYATWVLLWVARIFFAAPPPTSTKTNICGLPQFRRSFWLFLGVLVFLVAMGASSVPLLYDSDYYPSTPAPPATPA